MQQQQTSTRERVCEAPNCGRTFVPRSGRLSTYCSNRCRTAWGRWSYPANAHAPIVYRGSEGV